MDFSSHPFGVPAGTEHGDKIKDILKMSIETQKRFGVSNLCLFVTIFIHRCLKAVNVPSKIVYGILKPGTGDIKIAHCWLDIHGHVVDNTFVDGLSESKFINFNQTCTYSATSVKDQDDLFLGDQDTKLYGVEDHDVSAFEWGLSNQDKALLLSENKIQIGQFFKTMADFMLDKYKVFVQPKSETVVTSCWNCEKSDTTLQKCAACKIAMYCSRKCQKKDWKCHKQVCLKPNTY